MAVPDDTSPAAALVQLELLRKAGPGRRAGLARSLSRTVIDLSRRELAARMPGAPERDVLLRWVALHYGEALSSRVLAYLQEREP